MGGGGLLLKLITLLSVGCRISPGQIARWLEVLAEYDFTILHRPGLKHSNADALSRLPCKQCGLHDPDTTVAHSDTGVGAVRDSLG